MNMIALVELVRVRKVLAGAKRRLYWVFMLFATSLASVFGIMWSQTQLATVFGTITDPSGAVIPVAIVTLLNQNTGLKREALTDIQGNYHLAGLPIGSYS